MNRRGFFKTLVAPLIAPIFGIDPTKSSAPVPQVMWTVRTTAEFVSSPFITFKYTPADLARIVNDAIAGGYNIERVEATEREINLYYARPLNVVDLPIPSIGVAT